MSYFYERLAGALIYCLCLIIAYIQLDKANGDFKRIRRIHRIYVVVLSVMAFFYIPSREADLSRLNTLGDIWVKQGFSYFLTNTLIKSPSPAAYIFIYLTRLTGIDGLLPCISAFVFYTNIFHINELVNKNIGQYSGKASGICLLFFMCSSTFISVISGIRSAMAYSIIARCMFEEMLNNKSIFKHLLLYVSACLLHSIGIPIVMLRGSVIIFCNSKSKGAKAIQVLGLLIVMILAYRYGSTYLENAITKYEVYTSNVLYLNSKAYIFSLFKFFVILIIILRYYGHFSYKEHNLELKVFILSYLALELVFLTNYVIFARFMGYLNVLFIYVISNSVVTKDKDDQTILFSQVFYKNILIICTMFLFLSYFAGDLSAYKFFIWR